MDLSAAMETTLQAIKWATLAWLFIPFCLNQLSNPFSAFNSSLPQNNRYHHLENMPVSGPPLCTPIQWTGTSTPGPTLIAIPIVQLTPPTRNRELSHLDPGFHLRPRSTLGVPSHGRPRADSASSRMSGRTETTPHLQFRFYDPLRSTNDVDRLGDTTPTEFRRQPTGIRLAASPPIGPRFTADSGHVWSHAYPSTPSASVSIASSAYSTAANSPARIIEDALRESSHDSDDSLPNELANASTSARQTSRYIGSDEETTAVIEGIRKLFQTWRAGYGAGVRRVRKGMVVVIANVPGASVKRASYPPEYKLKALDFVKWARVKTKDGAPGKSISKRQAAKELGVTPKMLRDWETKRDIIEEALREARNLHSQEAGIAMLKDEPSENTASAQNQETDANYQLITR
ncbi:hypothetical protein DFH27DRAFT_574517 [Peziza echinospora]|nr:hypothetical protein DFH27DRAFT_574517 [Peziza echinospora]